MSPIHQLEIELKIPTNDSTVIVDGVDISREISRITIDADASDRSSIPKVYVESHGHGPIKVNGIALQRMDQREAVIHWLVNLDPEKLENEALEGLGLEGATTTGESIIRTLLKWAGADQDGS